MTQKEIAPSTDLDVIEELSCVADEMGCANLEALFGEVYARLWQVPLERIKALANTADGQNALFGPR